jgi:hypothetical protein
MNANSRAPGLVKAIVFAGLYPNVARVVHGSGRKARHRLVVQQDKVASSSLVEAVVA